MIRLKSIDYKKSGLSTLAIPVCEDIDIYTDKTVSSLVKKATGHAEFKGAKGESIILHHTPGVNSERVVFFGVFEINGRKSGQEMYRI